MSGAAFRPCAVVPTFENAPTVGAVVERIRAHELPVVLVDDGSGPDGERACAALDDPPSVFLRRFAKNRGKGAAVMEGMRIAHEQGFTHAFQIDADAQHDLACVPEFLAAAREDPTAAILGYPVYDRTAPASRRFARHLTTFWVTLEVGNRTAIRDGLIGFRVYPVAASLALPIGEMRMGFDVEIAVRLVRAGVPTVNLPVPVRYLTAEEGGISHMRPVRDNLRFAWLHTRLCLEGCAHWLASAPGSSTR